MRHKLASYILKNPSEMSKDKDDKDEEDNGASSKRDKKKGKGKKGKKDSSSGEEEEAEEKEEEKLAKSSSRKKKDDDEDDVVWSTDTSKEAVETRRRQMLDDTSELAAKLLLADKPGEEKADPIETLVKFTKENPSNEKLSAEIRKVQGEENWNEEQVAQVAFYLLFDANVVKQLQITPKISLLKEFVSNDKAQLGVLNGVVQLVGKDETLRKAVPHILKGLYDEDILEEEVLIKWHTKKSKGDTAKVKEAGTVFIDWLKNAEEESDEDDDEEEESD